MTPWGGEGDSYQGLLAPEVHGQNLTGVSRHSSQDQLIKQTYTVWAPTSRETRKWHLGEGHRIFLPCRASRVLIVDCYDSQWRTLRFDPSNGLVQLMTTPTLLG